MFNGEIFQITEQNAARGSLLGLFRVVKQVWWGVQSSPFTSDKGVTIADGQALSSIAHSDVNLVFYPDGRVYAHKNYSHSREYTYYYSLALDRAYQVYNISENLCNCWTEEGTIRHLACDRTDVLADLEAWDCIEIDRLDFISIKHRD